jgi:hypothetical protein
MRYVGVDLHKQTISLCVVELVGRERKGMSIRKRYLVLIAYAIAAWLWLGWITLSGEDGPPRDNSMRSLAVFAPLTLPLVLLLLGPAMFRAGHSWYLAGFFVLWVVVYFLAGPVVKALIEARNRRPR